LCAQNSACGRLPSIEFIDENGGGPRACAYERSALGIAISDNLLSLADEVIE
jgi:hypothetical protein